MTEVLAREELGSSAIAARFKSQIEASISAKQGLMEDLDACIRVGEVLIDAYRNDHVMLIFGNGGSAADAQHIAAEFIGRFYIQRRGVGAHALTTNTSALTAIANDFGFEQVFARQVQALGRPGDVAIGISTSGNAANVLTALEAARAQGMTTVAMTGAAGGKAKGVADHWVRVPADDVARIQESHILIGHVWSELVEAALFG